MNNDQRIQAYFNHQLSQEERIAFEKSLGKDKDLRESFEEYQAVYNAFKINDAERLKARLLAHEKGTTSKKVFNFKPFFYAIAASFLILIGVSFYFNFFQQDLYGQYFETYPNVYQPVVRGSADESTKAFMYYENQDFESAQKAFENLLKEEDNPNVRFYYALALLNDDKVEAAVSEFKLLEGIEFEFQAEVLWYNALSLIKLDRLKEAKVLLQIIKTKAYSFNKDKVDKLLEKLK